MHHCRLHFPKNDNFWQLLLPTNTTTLRHYRHRTEKVPRKLSSKASEKTLKGHQIEPNRPKCVTLTAARLWTSYHSRVVLLQFSCNAGIILYCPRPRFLLLPDFLLYTLQIKNMYMFVAFSSVRRSMQIGKGSTEKKYFRQETKRRERRYATLLLPFILLLLLRHLYHHFLVILVEIGNFQLERNKQSQLK